MGYIAAILAAIRVAFVQTSQASPIVWLTIAFVIVLAYFSLWLAIAFIGVRRKRRQNAVVKALIVKISDDDDVDTQHIRLTPKTRKELNYYTYQTVTLRGLDDRGKPTRGRSKLVEILRRNSTGARLQDGEIEMSFQLYQLLFPNMPFGPNDTHERKFQFVAVELKRGLQQFWFNMNDQVQYQNRFSVYLTVGLTVIQLFIGWVPR